MKYIEDSITNTVLSDIAHGVNAQGVMGSGVAKAIREKWPRSFDTYAKDVSDWHKLQYPLGQVSTHVESGPFVNIAINHICTQEYYGRTGLKYARYTAIVNGLEEIIDWWSDTGAPDRARRLAIPKIGCGLGGLKWEVVEELLLEIEEKCHFEFWVYVGAQT